MIRTSTRIAIAAIIVSLFLHVISIGVSGGLPENEGPGDGRNEVVNLETEFEALTDLQTEPVEAETITEPPPEPDLADTPTSEALVASPNPQATATPGTGEARPVQPEDRSPTETTERASTAPSQDIAERPEPPTTPLATPDGADATDVAESAAPSPNETPPVDPTDATDRQPTQQIAALPVEPAPTAPITPAPSPTDIPIVPSETEALDPASPEETIEALPQEQAPADEEQSAGGSTLAVSSSPRPPPRGEQSFSEQPTNQPPPILLTESPLVAYARGQSLGDWSGRQGTGGAGNSTVTNYAGRVLVHLNSAPKPDVRNKRGSARVVFVISADGSLASVDVVESTGNFELDRAARLQVQNASPFPRPPDGRSRRLSFIYRNR
ncbi:MAG: TonB family protein [Pseudomonadota bacterium]